MKTMKKCIAAVLALVMALSLSLTAFAATADNVKQYNTYTFLGDSIAAGHSLDDYYTYGDYGDGHLIKDSYAQIVADAVGAEDVRCDAMQGVNSSALRYLLDEDYTMDAMTQMLVPMLTSYRYNAASYAVLRTQIQQDIADSDLITIGVGSNDMMYAAMICLFKAQGINMGYGKSIEEREVFTTLKTALAENDGDLAAAILQAIEFLEKVDKAGQLVNVLISDLNDAYNNYMTNMNVIIEKVKALNPDAEVVLVGMYNPLRDMKISDDLPISIGHIADLSIMKYNVYLQTAAQKAGMDYACVWNAEVYECFTVETMMNFTNGSFFADISHCVHPTVNGHAYMAKQILGVLPTA